MTSVLKHEKEGQGASRVFPILWKQKAMCLSYAHVSIAAQSVFICWGVVLVSLLKSVCVGVGGMLKKGMEWGKLGLKDGGKEGVK